MARTKAEVRAWLNAQVGKQVADKSDYRLNGQCVALVKGLMEYLGVKAPYAARGNARDAGDSYLRDGIAKNGDGWLRVVINRDMGVVNGRRYGHIWIDLKGEANYEQNGARALHVTKNTRPYSQRQQVVNLDNWIKEEQEMVTRTGLNVIYRFLLGTAASEYGKKHYLGKVTFDEAYKRVLNSNTYRQKVSKAAKSREIDLNQLPQDIRKALSK